MTFSTFESFFKKDTEFQYVGCDGKQRVTKETLNRKEAINFLKSKTNKIKNKSIGLIVPEGYVVVDIDEGKEVAKQIIQELGIRTLIIETPKGLHLFFKTRKKLERKIKVITPFGLRCDQLPAFKSYTILPPNNPKRKIYMAEKITTLPTTFTPLINQKDSLLGLGDGDGRNDRLLSVLSSYMKKNKRVDKDDLHELAVLINKYVFAEPLKEKELYFMLGSIDKYKGMDEKFSNVKVRDSRPTLTVLGMEVDRFGDDGRNRFLLYNDKGKPMDLDHLEIADLLVNSGNFCVVHEQILRYENGVFKECGQEVRDLIKTLAGIVTVTKQAKIMDTYKSILDDIRLQADPQEFDNYPNLINFKNCVLDIETGKRYPHDPKYRFTTQIPHNIHKRKDQAKFKKTKLFEFLKMTKMPIDDQQMLLDFMAYMLTKNNNLRAFLAFVGQGGTGKSAVISYMQKMIGEENTSAIALQDIGKRFMAAALENKMLNVCADNATAALYQIDTIKKLTGGDTLMCEYKGRDPYPFTPYAKLCFSFNQMPRQLEEKSDAYYDRMRIIRMDNPIILDKSFVNDFFSEEEFTEVLSFLAARLPLDRVRKSENSLKEVEIARRRSDSIYDFLKSDCKFDKNRYIEKELIFEMYTKHCRKSERTNHAYYLFFDYLMDYPEIQEVEIEYKGVYKTYIKGVYDKRHVYEPPLGLPEDEPPKDEPEEDYSIYGDDEEDEPKNEVSEHRKKTSKGKSNSNNVSETNVRKSLVVELNLSKVKYPKYRKLAPKIFEINFQGVQEENPPTLVYEFDFTALNLKEKRSQVNAKKRKRRGIKGNSRLRE